MLALSDGLFATALTLLVLDLRIPEALSSSDGHPLVFVKWLGPHLFSYLLTFLVAGGYWLAHHRNFEHLKCFERGLLSYNLLFLLFIGLFPFTTAGVSGRHYQGSDFAFFWTLYAVDILMAGVMLGLMWAYAISHQLLIGETTQTQSRYLALRQAVMPSVFLLSVFTEWLNPEAFWGPYTLLLIPLALWWVDHRFAPIEERSGTSRSDWRELLWRAGAIVPWLLIIALAVWAMTLR